MTRRILLEKTFNFMCIRNISNNVLKTQINKLSPQFTVTTNVLNVFTLFYPFFFCRKIMIEWYNWFKIYGEKQIQFLMVEGRKREQNMCLKENFLSGIESIYCWIKILRFWNYLLFLLTKCMTKQFIRLGLLQESGKFMGE